MQGHPPRFLLMYKLLMSVLLTVNNCRDILPVLSTLRHNEFFEGVVDRSGKMPPEFIEELGFVLNVSRCLKKLELTNCALKL